MLSEHLEHMLFRHLEHTLSAYLEPMNLATFGAMLFGELEHMLLAYLGAVLSEHLNQWRGEEKDIC